MTNYRRLSIAAAHGLTVASFATAFLASGPTQKPFGSHALVNPALSVMPNTETWEAVGVDMDKYNLPLEDVYNEWTAQVTPESFLMEEGIYLGARDSKNNYADIIKFEVGRTASPGGGLGIELLELAGGREDGLGITICSGLVPGGNAEKSGILPGDSIVSIAVEGRANEAVSTECLGYDGTVEAILGLPEDWETLNVGVKRLRRKPKVTVNLRFPPEEREPDQVLELFAGENLRRAMLTRGVKLNDALSRRFDSGGTGDCGAEGTCATCVVNIRQGGHLLNPIGIQEKQILQKNPRWRLACKTVVGHGGQEGDMVVDVNPRQW